MALWGNNDNITRQAGGVVSLNYGTGVVTGTGTTFGTTGYAEAGDIIRFGIRGSGGTFFGDAVIVSVASTVSLTIGSTDGLSGAAIANTSFYVSELPKYTITDHAWSEKHSSVATWEIFHEGTSNWAVGVGTTNISLKNAKNLNIKTTSDENPDSILNNSTNIEIAGVGTAYAAALSASGVGSDKAYVNPPAGVVVGDHVWVSSVKHKINSVAAAEVGLAVTIASGISAADMLKFEGDTLVSLKGTLGAGIATEARVDVERLAGGYDRVIYGVDADEVDESTGDYKTSAGWVRVTTYMGCEGEMRVKKEFLVAMSGITTGNWEYPTYAG